MMKRISQAELDVMEALWQKSPMAASDVARRLEDKNWNIRTVKTLLSRLVEKDVISTQQDGRRYLYSPLVTKSDYARRAARRLSDRLFGGRAAPLVAHLAAGEGLSSQDIAELEALLQELKNER
ncbi:MAG: BlaI/MecI/CopY family transcriptional regulator [Hellea sp.]|nr:BlaI/MecI/CopY family transcriptional regulator [Hellea sp.]